MVWSDVEGSDQLVADATEVTTIRTGAVSGVATDLLAPPDARRLVVIGTGAQAADQVRAVHAVRPLGQLVLVGRDRGRADALAGRLADELPGVDVEATTDVGSALGTAEIVCCATTATEPLFALDALPAQVHVNAIGSYRPTMRELPDALLGDGLVVVDERGAILEEAGEVRHALDAGVLGVDDLVELGVALTDGVDPHPADDLQVGRRRDAGLGDRPAARRRVPRLTPGRGAAFACGVSRLAALAPQPPVPQGSRLAALAPQPPVPQAPDRRLRCEGRPGLSLETPEEVQGGDHGGFRDATLLPRRRGTRAPPGAAARGMSRLRRWLGGVAH